LGGLSALVGELSYGSLVVSHHSLIALYLRRLPHALLFELSHSPPQLLDQGGGVPQLAILRLDYLLNLLTALRNIAFLLQQEIPLAPPLFEQLLGVRQSGSELAGLLATLP
jgi:hypothetical protein